MPKKIATNADKDDTTISNSVFPCLDNARPANTPPTPTRRLISFFILFATLHLVTKIVLEILYTAFHINLLWRLLQFSPLHPYSHRNVRAARPPQYTNQDPDNPISQYFHCLRDIMCGAIWWPPVIIQPKAKQKTKSNIPEISQNKTWEDVALLSSTPRKGKQVTSKMHPRRKSQLRVFL